MSKKTILILVLAIAITVTALWLLGPLKTVLGGGNVVTVVVGWADLHGKLLPNRTYRIVFTQPMPIYTAGFAHVDRYRPFKIEVIIKKPGLSPAVATYCTTIDITTDFVGNLTVLRWPIFENGSLIGEKVCIYINGTFLGCYRDIAGKVIESGILYYLNGTDIRWTEVCRGSKCWIVKKEICDLRDNTCRVIFNKENVTLTLNGRPIGYIRLWHSFSGVGIGIGVDRGDTELEVKLTYIG